MPACVAYLTRRGEDVALVRAFLDSYRTHAAGREHELVMLLKGFGPGEDEVQRELAAGVSARVVDVPDTGYDITAYERLVHSEPHECFCFLNASTRILAPGWLDALLGALEDPTVGAAGASGAWTSHRSSTFALLGLPSSYRGALHDRRELDRLLARLAGEAPPRGPGVRRRLSYVRTLLRPGFRRFEPFPSPHLRTTAFAARSHVLRALGWPSLRSKFDAYAFESGREGLTRQVEQCGLRVLVMGRDGHGYPPDRWPASGTFWQAGQENLLVADKQTDHYASASPSERRLLAELAWGDSAVGSPRVGGDHIR